jgi:hypothetical protein
VLFNSTQKTLAVNLWIWALVNLAVFVAPGSILSAIILSLSDWRAIAGASPHDIAWTAAYLILGSGSLTLVYGEVSIFALILLILMPPF